MKHQAFTLSEVLITLGIIGVVAAMTLPALIQNWNEKASVTKVKKAYSLLNQAYLRSKEDNGPISEWNIQTLQDLLPYFTPYIKNIRICNSKENGCQAKSSYDLTGKSYTNGLEYYHFIDASGIAYVFRSGYHISKTEQQKYGGSYPSNFDDNIPLMYVVIANINYKKQILRYGIDTFVFFITDKGIVPYGIIGWSKGSMCNPSKPSSSPGWWNGMGCAGWVISEGNMDYMKCVKGNQKYCERGNYNP